MAPRGFGLLNSEESELSLWVKREFDPDVLIWFSFVHLLFVAHGKTTSWSRVTQTLVPFEARDVLSQDIVILEHRPCSGFDALLTWQRFKCDLRFFRDK